VSDPLRLIPLPPDEYARWMDHLNRGYAEDHVKGGRWTAAEALEKATAETQALLPQGAGTPDHYIHGLREVGSDQTVGVVWFHAGSSAQKPNVREVFIYDLEIFEPFRGRGYGTAAMRLVEGRARELGLDTIALHVFGHNTVAIALYQKLGYVPTNIRMAKQLGPAPPADPKSTRAGSTA
jgi:ribosomal protein S18 acetylase RimI-like enzyme